MARFLSRPKSFGRSRPCSPFDSSIPRQLLSPSDSSGLRSCSWIEAQLGFWLVSAPPVSNGSLSAPFTCSKRLESPPRIPTFFGTVALHYRRASCNALSINASSVIEELGTVAGANGLLHSQTLWFSQQSDATLKRSLELAGDGQKRQDSTNKENDCAGRIQNSYIEKVLPRRLRPFAYLARLDKPIGTWLLAWPCLWSIALAAPPGGLPDLKLLGLFAVGAVLLRGAGCTMNDLLDQNIDRKVERTKSRPIASGALTSFQGLSFLGLQLFLGLGILLQLNTFSQLLGASSLLLVGTYPLMKRWTYWPQAYLGLTFNWGALLGWAAVEGSINPYVIGPLYLSGVCWTMVYDTIYAHQDKEDDIKVGVKSTALYFGSKTKLWLGGFGIACVSSLCLAGYNNGLGMPFYASLIAATCHLLWQISTVDLQDRADCNSKFQSNRWFGALVFIGVASGKLVAV